jgi:two-component system, sensor histidine kinase RegB
MRLVRGHDPEPPSPILLLNFRWLTALRWVAIIGQTLAIGFVHWWMDVPLPLGALGVVMTIELIVNVVATERGKSGSTLSEGEIAAFVALDSIGFSALLYLTGGPSNPFTLFYIVHVAVAALILSPPYAWSLVGLSVASYSALFLKSVPLTHAVENLDVHLYGVWVAYGLGATCIVYFLQRARAEIEDREQLLAEQAELRRQADQLNSLATLAAGAAHELGSPLGTIAVVSKELEYELERVGHTGALADVALVRTQVERCRKILTRMAHTAGEARGESDDWIALQRLLADTVDELAERARVKLHVEAPLRSAQLKCPKEALQQTLRVLLENALDASTAEVSLDVGVDRGHPVIAVTDSGAGMDAPVLRRVFEPFFTTKAPGKGMGLGLFLARNVVTGMGGNLALDSKLGAGTKARITLPSERIRL